MSPSDYFGGDRRSIGKVLNALPVAETIAFFREIGVALHTEEFGKLFPDSNSARTVLAALLGECERLQVKIVPGQRVASVAESADGFLVRCRSPMPEPTDTPLHAIRGRAIVLATGGRSLPKTGSDGGGYELARALGHTLVPQTPALAPLVLRADAVDGERPAHPELSGISHPVELTILAGGQKPVRTRGPLLWTHFGISGPAAMDISRVWLRARLEQRSPRAALSFCPGESFESIDARLVEAAAQQPRTSIRTALESWLPARVAGVIARCAAADDGVPMAHLDRATRRRLVHALTEWPLYITDSRGYGYAEATAGGVTLDEIDVASMQSRCTAGLFLVGEILDVDGRIGGFNFQWAWSSGFVAALGIDRYLRKTDKSAASTLG